MFLFTLFMTGIRNIRDTSSAPDAAQSKFMNIFMLKFLLFSDSWRMASVEDLRALRTLLRLFYITKYTVGFSSVIAVRFKSDMR